MDVKTFRAQSVQDALQRIRVELGPDAAVLHTREVPSNNLLHRLMGGRQIEVTASTSISIPSRLPKQTPAKQTPRSTAVASSPPASSSVPSPTTLPMRPEPPAANAHNVSPSEPDSAEVPLYGDDYRRRLTQELRPAAEAESVVERMARESVQGQDRAPHGDLLEELLAAELSAEDAQDLIQKAASEDVAGNDSALVRARVASCVEDEISIGGPIRVNSDRCRVVALVGPTGVGKTTTIAKLAANFRLREQRRVGLITVDTYRIAAVDQLQTYAEIIDLPMEVVGTPREMRDAVNKMSDLDLVLIDTAGRSPRDEVRIQELKTLLVEAQADEVQLVLSAVSSLSSMKRAANQFVQIGANSLIFTKLDEATGLGGLLPVVRACKLPLSYVTDGQNVPDDIAPANRIELARMILGFQAQLS